jgi:hypothetical protein
VIAEDGSEKWMFESHNSEASMNSIDIFVFWYGQIANGIFWSFILFVKILTLSPFWV